MEDQREKDSNLILKKSFTVVGVVLVLLGFYALATITSLVRAYIAKPNAQNGGIVILSRFVHISYTAALGIAGAWLPRPGWGPSSYSLELENQPQYRPPCDPSPSIDPDLSSMGPCTVT